MVDPSASTATPSATGGSASGPNAPDPLLGRTINERFRILSVIARGGMGKVYRAEQAPLGRICAVKVLNPNYAGDNDPEFHKRFFLEASIASKLSHPNTVTIFDYGRTDDDVYYMAMEYLEGRTLHRLIRDAAPLPVPRVVHIMRQVCRSLREAHGLGVIHRDLKPANIYLIHHDDDVDFVKVLDFGLVKNVDDTSAENLTQTGLFMGSPKYMAPEQIRGEHVTPRTDVYALGVVLFEMLTGKVPFDRGNSVNTLMAHVSDPVPSMHEVAPSAQLTPAIEDLVYRCLQKRAEDRFASMDEMIAALKRAAGDVAGTGEYSSGMSVPSGEIALRSGDVHLGGVGSSSDPSGSGPMSLPGGASGALSNPLAIRPTGTPPSLTATPMSGNLSIPVVPRSRTGAIVGALVLVSAVGGAFVWMHRRADVATHEAPAGRGVHTMPTLAQSDRTPASSGVHVAIDSTPPGAEVLEGTTSLGTTPLRVDWTNGDQGDPSRSHTFTLRLRDYADAQVTAAGAQIRQSVALHPTVTTLPPRGGLAGTETQRPSTPRASRPIARPRPAGTHPTGTGTHPPAGYRGIDDW